MRRTLWLSSALLGIVVLAGCAKAPTREIQEASQAMDVARSVQADQFAPASWSAAEDAQARLESEIKVQEGLFALSRSYTRAKTLAAEVKTAAEKAAADAEAGKETARTEAAASLERAKELTGEVEKLLANAPRGKGTAADVAAFRSDAAGSDQSLKDAESAFSAGNYLEAKAKADAALQALEKVKSEIQAAQRAHAGRGRA